MLVYMFSTSKEQIRMSLSNSMDCKSAIRWREFRSDIINNILQNKLFENNIQKKYYIYYKQWWKKITFKLTRSTIKKPMG
jgi:hypothetical protein